MSEPVIEVRDLDFGYEGGPAILQGAHLTVRRGEYVAVLGPNGGGKSTLIKLLLGILEPEAGTIRVLGKTPAKVAGRLGYMPQYSGIGRELPARVIDMALMGLLDGTSRWFHWTRDERRRAERALDRVGMLSLKDRRITRLSGGQRQRALIARALVSDPEILFLDEPTASVDAEGRCALLELLAELNREVTIVYVSHDLSVVASGAHSVACVNGSVHFHPRPEITREMLTMMYGDKHTCPVEVFTHGDVPHRVVPHHGAPGCCPDREGHGAPSDGGHDHD
ncbi:metal ABC transporter ATP-binding protein [Desulfovibrio ferrophilus]|uniref:ABC transporter related protein n=1 Tax=Desulfovibrio ferrophilus TaxID=241368 RepID=A0A2Z6AZN6_9BACT|nr:metal ABC transporter ATP-binding protein [Desulfovibrio ferrophilus]BBD08694.1 ABC transporter related protein [Desulfovibrio ferrophilus]